MNSNSFNKRVGKKIKLCRTESNLSQPDLAKVLKYESATAISLIESGDRGLKIEDLVTLSQYFKKPYEYFLGNASEVKNEIIQDEILEDLARKLLRAVRNKNK